jgi:hypothetical protein
MTVETIISNIILKQGILGALVLILIFLFRRFIIELFKLVKNNTEAMTKNSEALYQIKDVIKNCNK